MHEGASAIILAGGRSARMGRAKAALQLGGATLLERLLDELSAACDEVIVIAAPVEEETYAIEDLLAARSPRVRILRDAAAFRGPAHGLIEGLSAARHPEVFACSCDLPFLTASVARAVLDRLDGFEAAIPVIEGRSQPLCAAYRASCVDGLRKAASMGESRLTKLVERLRVRRIAEAELRQVDPELLSMLNLNTPADYQRALALNESSGRA